MEHLYQSSKIKLPHIIIINFPQLLLFYDYVYYILSLCDCFTLFFESAKLRALCGGTLMCRLVGSNSYLGCVGCMGQIISYVGPHFTGS